MGVFENVVVLGRSGADLETELLHHQTSGGAAVDRADETTFEVPASSGAEPLPQPSDSTDVEDSSDAGGVSPPDANEPAASEAPSPDPGAGSEPEAIEGGADSPPET